MTTTQLWDRIEKEYNTLIKEVVDGEEPSVDYKHLLELYPQLQNRMALPYSMAVLAKVLPTEKELRDQLTYVESANTLNPPDAYGYSLFVKYPIVASTIGDGKRFYSFLELRENLNQMPIEIQREFLEALWYTGYNVTMREENVLWPQTTITG